MKFSRLMDRLSSEELRQAYTLMVLFDDTIDAETSLTALRRAKQEPSEISVIFRERMLDPEERTPHRTVLSVVVAKSALDVVGSWLQGLASLVLPDRATYLAAGPIGAILATLRESRQHPEEIDGDSTALRTLPTRQLTQAFQSFGFDSDESNYVEQRVVAGSPLIAVTSESIDTLRTVHQIVSQNTPVYIGLVRTEASILSQASKLLARGPRGTGAVVIADAISPLRHLRQEPALMHGSRDLRGKVVRSVYGEVVGRVDDVLFEPEPESPPPDMIHTGISDEHLLLRYVVIHTSRRLGRRKIAIPGERISIASDGVIVAATHEDLVSAPRYDAEIQLSRQDEMTIRRHYGEPFYWISG